MEKSPDAFRTISEAAQELDLPQHVLRFWETRFSQIKPLKRGGGRRYYRPDDVQLLRGIRFLLYDEGFTIKGVQKILKENGARHVITIGETGAIETVTSAGAGDEMVTTPQITAPEVATSGSVIDTYSRARLNEALHELLECKRILDKATEEPLN
ncbi:MerR family transcriptional regulator [Maritalea sp.]|uniref:MerR family transcriptional regulator n=1 Tax=Maritalea sp. TaxID=2003361 RepID=UPI003EFAECBB